jgi:TonB family protein
MTLATPENPGWSGAKWFAVVTGFLAVQVLSILFLSRKMEAPQTAATIPPVKLLPDASVDPGFAEMLSLKDPLVFFRLDQRAFSRESLLTVPTVPTVGTNWMEPFLWMEPLDRYFTDDFRDYVAGTVPAAAVESERIPPQFSEVQMAPVPVPERAIVRIEGGLSGRRLMSKLPVPLNESPGPLLNTVLSVVVDSSGTARSATILSGSGSSVADGRALDFARQARFFDASTPSGPAGMEIGSDRLLLGRLVFQWFPATARPAAPAPTTEAGKR